MRNFATILLLTFSCIINSQAQESTNFKHNSIYGELLGRSKITSINFEHQFSKHFGYQTGVGYASFYIDDLINASIGMTYFTGHKHQLVATIFGVINYNLEPYPKTKKEREEQIRNYPFEYGIPALGNFGLYYFGITAGYRLNMKRIFIQLSPFCSFYYHSNYQLIYSKRIFVSLSIGYKM